LKLCHEVTELGKKRKGNNAVKVYSARPTYGMLTSKLFQLLIRKEHAANMREATELRNCLILGKPNTEATVSYFLALNEHSIYINYFTLVVRASVVCRGTVLQTGKINELATNSKNKNIRDLYKEIIGAILTP
jgi:hypothetical protein